MNLRLLLLFGVGLVVVSAGLGGGLAFLVADREPWVSVVASSLSMPLILVPGIAVLTIANFSFDVRTPDGRKPFRRVIYVTAGLQVLALVGLCVLASVAPELFILVPELAIVGGVSLMLAVRLGLRLQKRTRNDVAHPDAWAPWPATVIRRKVNRIVIVFVVTTAVVIVGGSALEAALSGADEVAPFGFWLVYGPSFGLIGAALATLVAGWPLMKSLRTYLGQDYPAQKAVVRVVLRGKKEPLTPEAEAIAPTYAAILTQSLPFNLAQFILMVTGLWLPQLWNATVGRSSELFPVSLLMTIFFPLVLVLFLPLAVRQLRRVQSYSRQHPVPPKTIGQVL